MQKAAQRVSDAVKKRFLIFVGAPGAGKGTQTHMLVEKYGLPSVCAGDLLRHHAEHDTATRNLLAQGKLVPEELTAQLMLQSIMKIPSEQDKNEAVILDGFPRNEKQYTIFTHWFKNYQHLFDKQRSLFIVLDAHDDAIHERLLGRRIHLASGRSYHDRFRPPQVHNKDDITGEPLIRRDDDSNEAAIAQRLVNYKEKTNIMLHMASQEFHTITIEHSNSYHHVFEKVEQAIHHAEFLRQQKM